MTYRTVLSQVFPFCADVTKRQADSFACVLINSKGSFAVTCDNRPGRVYFWMSDTAKRQVEEHALMLQAVEFERTVHLRPPCLELDVPREFVVSECSECQTRHAPIRDCSSVEPSDG